MRVYFNPNICRYSIFFFFSSRRRHTRWNCDWSSDVCSSDLPVSAISLPPGPVASADGTRASPAGSRLGVQRAPPLRVLASGENVRSWLGLKPATSAGPPGDAATRPPLSATPGGVASRQLAVPAGLVSSCQKLLCLALDPPISTIAQLGPPGMVSEVTSEGRAARAAAGAGDAADVLPHPATKTAASAAAIPAARGSV